MKKVLVVSGLLLFGVTSMLAFSTSAEASIPSPGGTAVGEGGAVGSGGTGNKNDNSTGYSRPIPGSPRDLKEALK